MPTSTTIDYYPSTANFWTGNGPWYAAAGISAAAIIVILIIAQRVQFKGKSIAILCVILACFGGTLFLKRNPPSTWVTPAFAPETMLSTIWENYKNEFIESSSGRTIDDPQNGETTSEAEGYTMLRAVWMDDQPTFDASWQWTQKSLQRPDDLFSWLYGKLPNGSYGVLTAQNGENSASDADTDIALALIFAYSRWQNPAYLQAAVPIVKNIWGKEVFAVNGTPYLGPDNVVSQYANAPEQLIDPSYLEPYAYRIFSYVDPGDNWNALIDSSYQIIDKGIAAPLGISQSIGLPPDWMEVNTATGALSAPPQENGGTNPNSSAQTTDFGYDALRVPFRIALDWEWYGDPRSSTTLSMMGYLGAQWSQYRFLDAVYQHDGTPAAYYQTPAMYGGAIGYFLVADPGQADAVYTTKLLTLYDPDTATWKVPLDYYDANIAWFGMALYNHDLPNLFSLNLPTSTPTTH